MYDEINKIQVSLHLFSLRRAFDTRKRNQTIE